MSAITYNPMPGHLREKLILFVLDVLNKILKNNGFLDTEQINADIANLKSQINTLLSEVFGVEHYIDAIHNYDDMDIKSRLEFMNASLEDMVSDIETYFIRKNIPKSQEIKKK
jgi:hypothetical protein